MFLTSLWCFFVILIGLFIFRKREINGGKQLPGPPSLPFIGNILQIGFRPHVTFTKWAKRYGPIYKIKIGLQDAIIISDCKLIKGLFNKSASTGRMNENAIALEFTKGPYGVINSSGAPWEAQRKFTVKTLRTLGFAKVSMERMIMDEVEIMLDWFQKRDGSTVSGARIFNAAVVNSLWRLVTSERCHFEESRPSILNAMDTFFKEIMNVTTNGLLFAPVLRFIAPTKFRWNQYVKSVNKMTEIIQNSIKKHKETFDPTELRDYIDHHLFEIEMETDPNSSFYKDTGNANISAGMFDLFFAGSESSSASLSWTLLYLSENLEIQQTLIREIDCVLGSRLPSHLDRVKMPYTEAVISEVLRVSSVAPLGIPHAMMSDLIFNGYYLPKGAYVFANLYGVHHDPDIWKDPECFRPERFLNQLGTNFVQNEALIPFAEGKRKCIGDTFAKDTLFLFVTGIFQQFNVLPDPTRMEQIDLEADCGFLLAPKPFKVLVSFRKENNA